MCRVLFGLEHDAEMYLSLEFDFYIFTVTAIYCDCIGEKKNIKEYKLIFPNVCHFSLQPSNKAKKQIFTVLFNCEKDSVKKSRISA